MKTAKQNFGQFVYTNQTMPETTKQQSEKKMAVLEPAKISLAIWWILFWVFLPVFITIITKGENSGALSFFWMMFAIISLFLNIFNFQKRKNYKDVELMRILMKINKFKQYETPVENTQDKPLQKDVHLQANGEHQINVEPIQAQEISNEAPKPLINPLKRQLDFSNLAKQKILEILEVSKISCSLNDSVFELGEKINSNDIAWNKLSEPLLKEILDVNGISYKLKITKSDMVKLLK